MEVESNEHKVEPLTLMHYTEYDEYNQLNETSTPSTAINTVNTVNTNKEISNNTIDSTLLFKNKCKIYQWTHYNHMIQKPVSKPLKIYLFVSKEQLISKYQFPQAYKKCIKNMD